MSPPWRKKGGSAARPPAPLSIPVSDTSPYRQQGDQKQPQMAATPSTALPDVTPRDRGDMTPSPFARRAKSAMPDSLFKSVHAKQGLKVYKSTRMKGRNNTSKSSLAGGCEDSPGVDQRKAPDQRPPAALDRMRSTHQHLRVVIHEAKQLIAKDLNGYSDPFVLVELAGQRSRTRVVQSSLNPTWEQVVDLELPQILDRNTDSLKLTVLDYDGPVMQPQFLGRVDVNISDVWDTWKHKGESFQRTWCSLKGNRRTKRSDRGRICLSLTFIETGQLLGQMSQLQHDSIKRSNSLEDVNLNDWQLRVRIHEGRAFDTASPDLPHTDDTSSSSSRGYLYRVSVRLGSSVYPTCYSPSNVTVINQDDNQTGKYNRVTWEESFDIPLKEATKTLKLDTRINNHFMSMGNVIGLDGILYDTREDMFNTDDVTFVISRVPREEPRQPGTHQRPSRDSDRSHIAGVGQFPLSGIYAYSEDGAEELLHSSVRDVDIAAGEAAAAKQQQQQQEEEGEEDSSDEEEEEDAETDVSGDVLSTASAKAGWQTKLFKIPSAMLSKASRIFDDGSSASKDGSLGTPETSPELRGHRDASEGRRSSSLDDVSEGREEEEEEPSCEEVAPCAPLAQQTWISIDGKNGTAAGELLVSFLFVKGRGEGTSVAPGSRGTGGADEDFELWLSDKVETLDGRRMDEVSPMPMPPPLKDATFADLEIDIPLPELFYMQVNQDSKFNKLRRFEAQMRDFEALEWRDAEGLVKSQRMSYVIKLPPNRLGPNEAFTEVEMAVERMSRAGFMLRQTIKNPKITFGDAFFLVLQTVAVPVSPTRTRLQITCACEFTKSCIFKSTIHRASLTGAQGGCEKEVALLQRLLSGGDSDPEAENAPPSPGRFRGGGASDARRGGERLRDPLWICAALGGLLVILAGVLLVQLWAVHRSSALQIEAAQQSIALQARAQADQARLVDRVLEVMASWAETRCSNPDHQHTSLNPVPDSSGQPP